MSSDMSDDKLNQLRDFSTPPASDAARNRALSAALHAFDAAQQESYRSPQGADRSPRLRSIFHVLKGNWIMDSRMSLGFGTAAVALLMLPLGYQLYLSTAMTPVDFESRDAVGPVKDADDLKSAADEAMVSGDEEAVEPFAFVPAERAGAEGGLRQEAGGSQSATAPSRPQLAFDAPASMEAAEPEMLAAPAPSTRAKVAAPFGNAAATMAAAEPRLRAPTDPSGDVFTSFDESPVKVTAETPVSTFSIDVDTASYAYVRKMLDDGYMPEPDAVRIEEMINYFDYDYVGPDSAGEPFRATMQVYPTPWNEATQLLQIGIKGYVPPATEDKPSNLVFLLDTSGSMDEPDKLPLLKRAFSLLVDQLSANDTVSIVAYAGSAGTVLEPTGAGDKAKILAALDNLQAGGSTAGAAGIELAYQLAAQNKVEGGINRVILATDGDFNVGIDDPEDLETFIKQKRDAGIFLSVLGFGQGNYGDDTMQALAQNGNGNASYIDSFKEAQKVLVQELGGTLETIAQDVKIQVEFNPAVVSEYRLIGYETRALNREDFNNDKVDAGDIGAGHTVTALYEITPVGSDAELVDPLRYGERTAQEAGASDEIGFLKMRFKLPEETTSQLIETPIPSSLAVESLGAASDDARWAAAVAAFAQKLKGSDYGGTMSYDAIRALAQGARGADEEGYRAEFMQLISAAKTLDQAN